MADIIIMWFVAFVLELFAGALAYASTKSVGLLFILEIIVFLALFFILPHTFGIV